jgi:ATP-dependent Zn protease
LPEQIGRTVAVHETGHAIVAVATGIACPTLLALHGAGGVTEATVAKDLQDGPHLTAHLAVTLAGRAAECLVYGAPSAGSGGDPESDLAIATRNAAALEASFGLGRSLVWLGTPDSALARLRIDGDLRARVERRLVEAEARASKILQANQPLLAAIAEDLYDAGLLSGEKLAGHLAQVVPEDNRSPRARRAALECAGSLEPDGEAVARGSGR